MTLPQNILEILQEHKNINFRINEEQDFPWGHNISGVWYMLLLWEGRTLKHYGFSSSKMSKQELLEVLSVILEQGTPHLLLGIWTGEHTTHAFVLNSDTAIEEISWRQKLSGKELAESENLRERRLERKQIERKAQRSAQRQSPRKPQVRNENGGDFSFGGNLDLGGSPDLDGFGSLIRGLNEDTPDEESS
jgi:hypothetical protein